MSCAVFLLDILSVGAWVSLKKLDDKELKLLAVGLPETVLNCRAISTTKKYLGAYK